MKKNQDIANILRKIANYLAMEDVIFKPYAYQKAAFALENLKQDVEDIYKKGEKKGLENISGIGKNIAKKIEEYLKTGKIKYYQDLKKKMPVNIEELMIIEGLGPKMIKVLYQKLKIKNLKDLEKAANTHKIAPLFGFGKKIEENILQGIKFLKRNKEKFLLGEVLSQVKEVYQKLKSLKEIEKISLAGSIRRMKEIIGDVDFLVVSRSRQRGSSDRAGKKIMNFFVQLPGVIKVWGKGSTKSSVRMKMDFSSVREFFPNEIDMDIRVVSKKSYGSALQYFTGSKEHNIALRKIAISKGLKLNEYGLFRGSKIIAGKTEKEIYKALNMKWIPPELRENQGEIEKALRSFQGKSNGLPRLINYKDILGDLHCHSNWTKQKDSIEDLAETAFKMGYSYLGISDHTKFLKIEHGLNESQLREQRKQIDNLNKKFKIKGLRFKILQGAEVNILNNGSIDINDEALKNLDYVIAGVHSQFKMEKKRMTERIIRAMKNPNIDIIAHLTGRLIQEREEYDIDFDKILRIAQETRTILEINSFPKRLDLKDIYIKQAKEKGVKMIISSDSHKKEHLSFIEFGIAQARRGWAERKDIVNAYPINEMLRFLKHNK